MKTKIVVIIINAIIGGVLGLAIISCIDLSKKYEEQFDRLRIVETERNALSDAVRCYADDRDTTILEYSRWYLEVMGCPKTLEDWGNIY